MKTNISNEKNIIYDDMERLINAIVTQAGLVQHIVIMSNSGFGGLHQKVVSRLRQGKGF